MKFKKTIAFLTGIACSASMVLCGTLISGSADDNTVKIMSIGDSITDGYGTDGSYRKFLYNGLTESGYSIDMVGPNWSWGDAIYTDSETGESFTYDAAHCGYSGYAIKEYSGRSGILETIKNGNYLSEHTPDIVILQIGTNDVIDNYNIDTAGERLEELAGYILENISSESALFITTIPDLDPNRSDVYSWFGNYRHSADWQTNYSDEEAEVLVQQQVDNYNAQVKALVEEKQAEGVSNIYYGNVNSAVTDVKTQLKDGVHPNDVGFKLMGEYWTGVIKAYLSGESVQPTEPSTEATDPTEVPTETTESTEASTEATDPTETPTEATDPTEAPTETTESTEVSTEVTDPTEATTETTESTEASTEATVPTEEAPKKGDLNSDGNISVSDAAILGKFLTKQIDSLSIETDPLYVCDINSDGKINVFDLVLLKRMIVEA